MPKRQNSKNPNFMMAKARVDVRYMKYDLNSLKERLLNSRTVNSVYKNYALALIFLENKKFDEAASYLAKLNLPNNDFVLDVYTDIDIAQGRYQSAISRLKPLYDRKPNDGAIALNLANAYVEGKQSDGAIKVLTAFTRRHPNHA